MQILVLFLNLWYIQNYHVDMKLKQENSVVVTEVITVNFDSEERHGIYRIIPTRFRKQDLPFKLLQADNLLKKSSQVKVSRGFDEVNIRIGNPHELVTGIQKYIISYEVKYAVFDSLGSDFFIWNVTGNGWSCPIETVSVNLRIEDAPLPAHIEGFTGSYGEKKQNYSYTADTLSKIIYFRTTSPLMPYEGFTILLKFDGNYFKKPSPARNFLLLLLSFWPLYIPLLLSLILFVIWIKRGRDPYVGPVVVQYEPPPDLTPSESGVLIDEKVDPRDITAEIMRLILEGYISFEKYGYNDFVLKKLKDCDNNLKPHQCEILQRLFKESYRENDGSVRLSKLNDRFYVDYRELTKIIYKLLKDEGYFVSDPEKVRGLYRFLGFASFWLYFILFPILSARIFPFPLLLPLGAFMTVSVLVFFGNKMVAKTLKGAEALKYIRGLREFIKTVERDRLKRFALEKPEMFKTLLPYAIAFGEEEKWGRVFEEIYDQLREKTNFGVINVQGFVPALSYMGTSISSAPRSSGGGGSGGFSGGGAGGGGGGAW